MITEVSNMQGVQFALLKAEKEIEKLTGYVIRLHIVDDKVTLTERLKKLVCDFYKVYWEDITSQSRSNKQSVVDARHVYMYLAYNVIKSTLEKIALDCGGRDHTTVMYACKKVEDIQELSKDANIIKYLLFNYEAETN